MAQTIISITEFCNHYHINPSFVELLEQQGVIELQLHGTEKYIAEELLGELEQFRSFHFDLNINAEGIDVIRNLLKRQGEMEDEIARLRSTILFYESITRGEITEQ